MTWCTSFSTIFNRCMRRRSRCWQVWPLADRAAPDRRLDLHDMVGWRNWDWRVLVFVLDRVPVAVGVVQREAADMWAQVLRAGASAATRDHVAGHCFRRFRIEGRNAVAGLLFFGTYTLVSCCVSNAIKSVCHLSLLFSSSMLTKTLGTDRLLSATSVVMRTDFFARPAP